MKNVVQDVVIFGGFQTNPICLNTIEKYPGSPGKSEMYHRSWRNCFLIPFWLRGFNNSITLDIIITQQQQV